MNMNAELNAAWDEVIAMLEAATNRWTVTTDPRGHNGDYTATEDDVSMSSASDDELCEWVDDLEWRVGMDVADMRAAVLDYCDERAKARKDEGKA